LEILYETLKVPLFLGWVEGGNSYQSQNDMAFGSTFLDFTTL